MCLCVSSGLLWFLLLRLILLSLLVDGWLPRWFAVVPKESEVFSPQHP